jgi:ribonuclease D
MENDQIVKVGHTVSSDLQFLYQTFSQKMKIKNLVDLAQLFKAHFPTEIYSSLAYMADKFLHKKMCKYE